MITAIAQRYNKKVLLTGGIVSLSGVWIGFAVFHKWRKDRDRKAIAFFSELQREIAPDSVGLVESNAFDLHYWENIGKKLSKPLYMLTVASAKGFAKDIKDSWGGWLPDDEDKVYGVFRALKDHVQVSQVAYQYYLISGKINLIDDLKGRMDTDEVSQVMAIVKKLPPYRLAEPKK
jgi:hypothetical protein